MMTVIRRCKRIRITIIQILITRRRRHMIMDRRRSIIIITPDHCG